MTSDNDRDERKDGEALLVYDGDCGFCWATVRAIRRRWPHAPLRYITCQDLTRSQLIPDLDAARCLRAALLIDGDGTVYSGADLLPRFWQLRQGDQRPVARLWRLPGLLPVLRIGYRWVAHNRQWISRLLGTIDTPRRL